MRIFFIHSVLFFKEKDSQYEFYYRYILIFFHVTFNNFINDFEFCENRVKERERCAVVE